MYKDFFLLFILLKYWKFDLSLFVGNEDDDEDDDVAYYEEEVGEVLDLGIGFIWFRFLWRDWGEDNSVIFIN